MPLPAGISAVFSYPPNWSSPVIQIAEYKTAILEAEDGTEQRIALRSKPRHKLSYQVLLSGREAAEFEQMMWALQPYPVMVPLWPRRRLLSTDANPGTATIALNKSANDDVRPGDEWVLIHRGKDPEVVTLDSVSGDKKTLTLVDNLESDWPQGASALPAWRVQFEGNVTGAKLTSGVVRAPIQFRRIIDSLPAVTWSGLEDQTVGALEAITRPMNWSQPMQVIHNWAPEFNDSEIGPWSYDTKGDLPKRVYKGEIMIKSRSEADWWLAFFDRVMGRHVPFLIPSWQRELLLQPPLGVTTFEVPGTFLGTYQTEGPIHTHLMIRKKDGSLAFFTIETITADHINDVTGITTTEAWDESYGPEECGFACLMYSVRLASDTIELRWLTDEVATLTLSVQTVEDVA